MQLTIAHSKQSSLAEEVILPATSDSGQNFVQPIATLLQTYGVEVTEVAGVFTPVYFVVRVDLESITDSKVETLLNTLKRSSDTAASDVSYLKWLKSRIKERYRAVDDIKRFINVVGGSQLKCDNWVATLQSQNLRADTVPGPLLRSTRSVTATRGSSYQVATHMPISSNTAAGDLKELFIAAHHLYKARTQAGTMEKDRDTELIIQPKWGTHSARRGGTRRAQLLRHIYKIEPELIDLHFRWRTKKIKKKMQNRYAGLKPHEWRSKVVKAF